MRGAGRNDKVWTERRCNEPLVPPHTYSFPLDSAAPCPYRPAGGAPALGADRSVQVAEARSYACRSLR
eukprot:267265-Rhodomonas_salina.1